MGLAEKMNPEVMELKEADPDHPCIFCHKHEINAIEWGQMLQLDGVTVHYFCLLFSAAIGQNGEDNEGILGFLVPDILKEARRGKKLKCKYCKKGNATVGCFNNECKTSFHYTCGYSNGTLHQFYDRYSSYCPKHKPTQRIPKGTDWCCPICFVDVESASEAVWPPCCGKSVFHRSCIMTAAINAGYCFKCPLCNNSGDKFLIAMKCSGVYVPDQDAAWEKEPNAFAELMELYSRCDATTCSCPAGREMDDKADLRWKIIRCSGCGATATHSKCSGLEGVLHWKCQTCTGILSGNSRAARVGSSTASTSARGVRARASEDNLRYSSGSEDRTSEDSGDTSDSSDEEDERILQSIPRAHRGTACDTSGSDNEEDLENSSPLSEATEAELSPKPQDEAPNKNSGSGHVVYNATLNKQYRIVKNIELGKRKRKEKIRGKTDQSKTTTTRGTSCTTDQQSSNAVQPSSSLGPTSSCSMASADVQRREKRISKKKRKVLHDKPAVALGEDGEDAKLQSIYNNVPGTSSMRRKEEECRKRLETIQSVMQKTNEQTIDIGKLPKIPKLAHPSPKNHEVGSNRQKSILNVDRKPQHEEERNKTIRNHRGVDPNIFYHNHKRQENRNEPEASRFQLLGVGPVTAKEGSASTQIIFPRLDNQGRSSPSPTIAQRLQALSTQSSYQAQAPLASEGQPHRHRPINEPQDTNKSSGNAVTGPNYQSYDDGGPVEMEEFYYPFDNEERSHCANDNERAELAEHPHGSERQSQGGRAIFTAFYDDTPTITFRKPNTADFDHFDGNKLSRRSYRKRDRDEVKEREKFYNPHSMKSKSSAGENEHNTSNEPQIAEEKQVPENSSSTESGNTKDAAEKTKASSTSGAVPSTPTKHDESADEVQIATPPKKPEIEVISLSDSEDEIEVLSAKVVSPPTATVKSAAFMALLSGNGNGNSNPGGPTPTSSASTSSSVGIGHLFYPTKRIPGIVPHDYWFNQRKKSEN